ncbi:sensor histidine kinase [Bacillus mangrovi]|uniref:histidine kinase n=1 Tax=Metabacillus mangrovi TaxID=1491830 RepID=A0A7X2S6T4_9BACI|nr:sensor histidine kinase [Metabacillus mangrovi]MTH54708.1 sensor histidine kinase [Metabacillus mangrovi]
MISKYIREKISWIAVFLFTQSLILFTAFIDSTVPFASVLYMVALSTGIFLLFLCFRYQKETRFYRSLLERGEELDTTGIAEPDSPFEKIVEASMVSHLHHLKETAAAQRSELEREKDELLAWIHEVKTPLTAMNLIIGRIDDEKIKSQLNHEWLRIHLLLDRQLHQKRLPFMENDLYIENVNLQSLLFSELKTLQAWCMAKNIGFEVQLEAGSVLSDGKWLAFILRQILTNAVKYSSSSDIHVTSKFNASKVQLEIKDFGRGIDPKDLPRIFDKGFTSAVHHLDPSSTGMGLYLANKAARVMHMDLEASSTPNEGTSFILTFPDQNEFVKIHTM